MSLRVLALGLAASAPPCRAPSPTCADGFAHGPATNGISMKSSSGSTARSTTCVARSTSTAMCSTSWYSHAETRWPPRSSSADYSRDAVRAAGCSSPTSSPVKGTAHRVVMPSVEHRQSKYLNNRAENSHQPTRQRERAMKRFTSPRHAQRLLSAAAAAVGHWMAPRYGRALHRLEPDHRGHHDRRLNVNSDRAFHQNRRTTRGR